MLQIFLFSSTVYSCSIWRWQWNKGLRACSTIKFHKALYMTFQSKQLFNTKPSFAIARLYKQPVPLKRLHTEKMHLEEGKKERDGILISYGSSVKWRGFLWQSCLEHFCLQQRQKKIRVFLCQNPPIKQTVTFFLSVFTAFKPLTVL